MASIYKPTYSKKDPKTGKAITRKLSKWYVKYRDAEGIVRKIAGHRDKAATQQLAAKLEREAELGKIGISDPFQNYRKMPLKEHLDDFEKHLVDGERSKEHVHQTTTYARSIVDSCGFVFIDDISPSKVEAFLGDLREQGRSIDTSNHYLTAIKQFCRWLVKDRRTRDNSIAHLKKLNTNTDRRHDRRALSKEEFEKLIESAINGPSIQKVSGPERAMLYILAAWTGYRRKELASVTLRSFDFESEPPTLRVQARSSKHREDDRIPLHPVVVKRLHDWLATKGDAAPDEPLFALRSAGGHLRKTSKMMRLDLKQAGIPYQNEDGLFADFHSNRHTFISNLSRANVSPKMAQTLARHSDVNLTMNVYTHVGLIDQSSAVGNLPAPPKFNTNGSPPDGEHVPKHVPTAVSACRSMVVAGNEPVSEHQKQDVKRKGESAVSDTTCPLLSSDDSSEENINGERRSLTLNQRVEGSSPSGGTFARHCIESQRIV